MKQKISSNLLILQIILLIIFFVIGCNQTNKTSDNVDTKNWKTYTNAEYGFEFKYPSDWSLQISDWDPQTHSGTLLEGEYIFELSNCKNLQVVSDCSIFGFIGKEDYTYDGHGKLYAKDLSARKIGNYDWKFREQSINGIGAVDYFVKPASQENYYRFLYQEKYSNPQVKTDFNQILSTFKFGEQK